MRRSSSSDADTSEAFAPGARIGPYTIVRFLGTGGMATVFEGFHEAFERRVAIKVMHVEATRQQPMVGRFVREARTIARVRHPNVVEILDVGNFLGRPFLVMEHLEGETLDAALERSPVMNAAQAATVMLPIAAALATMHAEDVVHRDVKPENILLALGEESGVTPKLVDFGLAKELAPPNSGVVHTIAGTPHFMSPEQASGDPTLDGRTDQYSFGVILYRMLTGRLPYEAPSLFELMRCIDAGRPEAPRAIVASIPEPLARDVLRAMARTPAERFEHMGQLVDALAPYASARVRTHYLR